MTITAAIDDIIEQLTQPDRSMTVFCGAGISINAGLPSAIALLEKILYRLGIDTEDEMVLIRPDWTLAMPFELFFETFLENTDDTCVLDLFKVGEPTTTHRFLQLCYRKHILTEIYTTNFDLLTERAFEKHDALQVFRDEHSFSQVKAPSTACKLIKVHGSINDIASIRTTLVSIANRTLSAIRDQVIDRLFSDGPHKKVLIIGYSCSDIFDISPKIEKIFRPAMEVFMVEHHSEIDTKSAIRIEPINLKADRNPFRKFSGQRLAVNTDYFVKLLWEYISPDYLPAKLVTPMWEPFIDNWIAKFHDSYLRYTILGQLFYKITNYDLALKYHQRALTENNGKNKRGQGASLSNIGLIYNDLKDYDEALMYHRQANAVFLDISFYYGLAASYTNLGLVYINMDQKEQALINLKKSLIISRGKKFKESKRCESDALCNLGLLYERRGDPDTALDYYLQTLEIDVLESKVFEAGTRADIGRIYYIKGDADNSIKYFKASLDIGRNLGILSITQYAEDYLAKLRR